MERKLPHLLLKQCICVLALACILLSCGTTAFAAEIPQTDLPPIMVVTDISNNSELHPADVKTVIEGGKQKIVKTYNLSAEENPNHISRDSFELDGWRYTFADMTEKHTSSSDVKSHIEIVELNTESNDLNDILTVLSPTLEYMAEDGYSGLLTLALSSVKCEEGEVKSSSYAVSAVREYPNLPANDLAYIPKTITESGRTLGFDSVEWQVQSTVKAG